MGFLETVIAVALGIALGPYIVPLLKKIRSKGHYALQEWVIPSVSMLAGIAIAWFVIRPAIKGVLYRVWDGFAELYPEDDRVGEPPPMDIWTEDDWVSGAILFFMISMVIAGLIQFWKALRNEFEEYRSDGGDHRIKHLIPIRILAIGAVLLFFAQDSWRFLPTESPWSPFIGLVLAYSVIGGVYLYKKKGFPLGRTLGVLSGVFVSMFVLIAIIGGIIWGILEYDLAGLSGAAFLLAWYGHVWHERSEEVSP
jgi:hypothetical protein